jgi:hypothetical protein
VPSFHSAWSDSGIARVSDPRSLLAATTRLSPDLDSPET